MRRRGLRVAVLATCASLTASAADHRNLDSGLPLAVEDAYPVKFGEPAFHLLSSYRNLRGGARQGGVLAELEYGIARDVQVNLGTHLFGRTRDKNEGSGNVSTGLLYNFNTETLRAPALAVKAEAEFPTGVDSRGVDVTLKGILTKSAGHHRVHLNLGQILAASPQLDERKHRWEGVIGWDRPVGLQKVLIVDVAARESERRGDPVVTTVEAGIRQQITPLLVAYVGIGVGLRGGAEKQPFSVGFGLTRSF